jgi:hypothetical protein
MRKCVEGIDYAMIRARSGNREAPPPSCRPRSASNTRPVAWRDPQQGRRPPRFVCTSRGHAGKRACACPSPTGRKSASFHIKIKFVAIFDYFVLMSL